MGRKRHGEAGSKPICSPSPPAHHGQGGCCWAGVVLGRGCGCSPRSAWAWGCRGAAVPPRRSRPQAWQAMKAQLCSSGAGARPCLGASPGWDSSPRQRRGKRPGKRYPRPGSEQEALGTSCTPLPLNIHPPWYLSSILTSKPAPSAHEAAPVPSRIAGRGRVGSRRDSNRLMERRLEKSPRTMRGLRTRVK